MEIRDNPPTRIDVFSANRKNLVYVLILLIPFLIFFSRTKIFTSVKFRVVDALSLPIKIMSFPLLEIKKMVFYHRTFDEYRKKTQEVNRLKARLVGMEEIVRENARLERLLAFKQRLVFSSVGAHIVGRDPSRWNSSLIIDRGRTDGVEAGQPVVNELGVVGKITEVSESKSKVILLTDPQFSAAIMVQRTRESGVISGTLTGLCRLKFIKETADIRVGDKVITSRLSTEFPESLMVGEVVEIREGVRSNSKEYLVKPSVALSQLEEVLVIVN